MAKPWSVSTAPSFGTRSRTWPYEARTSKSLPRYLLIVFALAGDSTISRFFAMSGFRYLFAAMQGEGAAVYANAGADAPYFSQNTLMRALSSAAAAWLGPQTAIFGRSCEHIAATARRRNDAVEFEY